MWLSILVLGPFSGFLGEGLCPEQPSLGTAD